MHKKEKTIILFENDELKKCGKSCVECDRAQEEFCIKNCGNEIFEELEKLCSSKVYDFGLSYDSKNDSIKTKKYTGFFQIKKDVFVEILPKIHKSKEISPEIIDESRLIFENLIYSSNNLTKECKTAPTTNTKVQTAKLFEVYMTVFCLEMEKFLKKGMKKYYSTREDNLPYLKGKIDFSSHIKYNIAKKNMFYVNYDEFTEDIAENRILKSACEFVLKKTEKDENKKILRKCLAEFADVPECLNLEKDISLIQPNRFFVHYETPLQFAELFLRQKYFMPNKGKQKLPALLFPLHTMFEDYIKKLLDKRYDGEVHTQYKNNYLLKGNKYNTKMDFVVFKPNKDKSENTFVLDAKYKIIDIKDVNSNDTEDDDFDETIWYKNQNRVSHSDLYQLYAYSQLLKNKKNVKIKTALLYPKTDTFENEVPMKYFDETDISLIPVDLTDDLSDESEDKNKILTEFLK